MISTTQAVREYYSKDRGFHYPKLYPSAAGLDYVCPILKTEVNGGGCRKAEYLKFISMSYPNVMAERGDDLSLRMKATGGNILHDVIMDVHKANKTCIGAEVRFNWKKYLIGGKIDGLILDPQNGRIRICEIKTKSFFLKKMFLEPDKVGRLQPDDGAAAQAITYYFFINECLKTMSDIDIEECCTKVEEDGTKIVEKDSVASLMKCREHLIDKGPIDMLEIVYMTRDDLDMSSHFLHVSPDGRVVLMNDKHSNPVLMPYNANSVMQHFSDIIKCLGDFESDLDKLRTSRSKVTTEKFLDIVNKNAPADDFVLTYDDERLKLMYEGGLLTATDEKKYAKRNKLTKTYGDYTCQYCDHQAYCKGIELGAK